MGKKGFKSWNSWRVLIASSTVFFLLTPTFRLSSLFYVAVIEEYNLERDLAAIPFVVLAIVRSVSGLAFGILVEIFGLQCMAFVGSSLSVVGLATSYFAYDHITLSITLGLLYGFGFTVTALLPSVIRDYFNSDSVAISNGLLNVGQCLSAIVFPSILMYFLNEYGVSGTFLLTSGIALNAIPFVIILHKPVTAVPKRICQNKTYPESATQDDNVQAISLLCEVKVSNNTAKSKKSEESNEGLLDKDISIIEPAELNNETVFRCPKHEQNLCSCISNSSALESNNSSQLHQIQHELAIPQTTNFQETDKCQISKYTKNHNKEHSSQAASRPNISRRTNTIWSTLSVMKDPTFITLSIAQSLFAYTFIVVMTTMVDYSRDKKIDRSAEIYMLSFFPIPDIVSRLGLTWVTDKNYLSVASFSAILHLMIAASSVWMALSDNSGMMIAGVMLISFAIGGLTNLLPGMSYSYIAKDKQTFTVTSFGFLYAPLSFTVSPLIGYFRGHLGSYDGLYYLLAALNIICSITVLLLPILANRREKRNIKDHQELENLKRTTITD